MTWLVVVCGIANVFIGIWIGWTRGYEAGRLHDLRKRLDATARRLVVRGAREARRRWERDRVEPEEEDDNDRI